MNAFVWRLHEQGEGNRARGRGSSKKGNKLDPKRLSILKGRSMCPHCKHELAAKDLVPVLSWLSLKGKCRYCHKPISWQYPLVELITAGLFIVSYLFWPLSPVSSLQSSVNFIVWLVILVGFMALIVYDFKWMLLPNRIIYPLIAISIALVSFNVIFTGNLSLLLQTGLSVLIAGGIFYAIFAVSDGKWIGGGDVKLGFLIGLLLMDPYQSFLVLFLSSIIGTIVVVPGMLLKKVTVRSRIPFGPFLIIAAIIVRLFGASIVTWYKSVLLLQA
ncbi:prepilin peptidase [Candidatus Saccharibacteria bacterium]|nr:prepilin peptidase [Candidatus Saccharibacteria bacterium]